MYEFLKTWNGFYLLHCIFCCMYIEFKKLNEVMMNCTAIMLLFLMEEKENCVKCNNSGLHAYKRVFFLSNIIIKRTHFIAAITT